MAKQETADGIGGGVAKPTLRKVRQHGRRQQQAHDASATQCTVPGQPATACQPQPAAQQPAQAEQGEQGNVGDFRDGLIAAAQLGKALRKGLRHKSIGCDFRQAVSGQHQPEPKACLAPFFGLMLVDKTVVNAPAGAGDLRCALRRVGGPQRIVQQAAGAALGQRTRRTLGQRCTRRLLRHLACESVGTAIGREAHAQFILLRLGKKPHRPVVGRDKALAQQGAEGVHAAAFQFDVVLQVKVMIKACRRARRGEFSKALRFKCLGGGQRLVARHAHIELEQRHGAREQPQGRPGRGDRQCQQHGPECFAIYQGHGGLSFKRWFGRVVENGMRRGGDDRENKPNTLVVLAVEASGKAFIIVLPFKPYGRN